MDDAAGAPDWFWDALEAARPRLTALEAWLVAQPRETLEEFARVFEDAAGELADYSEGVSVDGLVWSEDATEELCWWVVGQGRAFWRSVATGDVGLGEAAQAYLGRTQAAVVWDETVLGPEHRGYQSPGDLVYGVYRSRFGVYMEDL
ncbi:hypothetical protein [Kitasatospora sp. NPDC101183]|uniref:hypothetical protein n=1 Tax=Kitasatospora sp. NPDC101183 TaxID=3364100 RepID=UPI0037F13583